MKKLVWVLIFAVLSAKIYGQERLYPIIQGDKWGYIDKDGKTVVKPQFQAAGYFSEGLAAVRIRGTYAYIDTNGTVVIPPHYDLATAFEDGCAKVFIGGKPFLIDKKGDVLFQHDFTNIHSFGTHTYAIAGTGTGKYCLIDKSGNLLTDTVFKRIDEFNDGLAVVEGLNHLPYPKDSAQAAVFECGVIDTAGGWAIPYGRYKGISKFTNGYATAARFNQTEKERQWKYDDAVINVYGNEKFVMPAGKFYLNYSNSGFHNGIAIVVIYPEKKKGSDERNDYRGVIDTAGNILFGEPDWEKITPFSHNRAFVKLKGKDEWKMINNKGQQIGDSAYKEVLFDDYRNKADELFIKGMALVSLSGGWVGVDTNASIVFTPRIPLKLYGSRMSRVGNMIFVEEDISVDNPRYSFRYGFLDMANNVVLKPTYHIINKDGFGNDLVYAVKDGLMYYINREGAVIWKERKLKVKKKYLDIDFMNRGYYYASSASARKDLDGYGGWGGSDNPANSASGEIDRPAGGLQLIMDTSKRAKWYGYKGMKVFVVNTSADTLFFNAQDSRLYMNFEALDKSGIWRDIEYLPNSWCGNSYHTLYLAPGEYWQFDAPVYRGEFETKGRLKLLYKKGKHQKEQDTVYGPAIELSVNPGQFWNMRQYTPRGIMDPYND